MHSCLQTAELQHLVFQELRGDNEALYAAVRTCRAFRDAATPFIWETISSLYPLMHNMPEDLIERFRDPDDGKLGREEDLTMKRGLEPEDWIVYHRFSNRVRNLHLTADIGIDDPGILDALALYRPAQILLPNLNALFIDVYGDNFHILQFLQTLLSPTVEHFTLNVLDEEEDGHQLVDCLLSLGRLCPRLSTLVIEWQQLTRHHDPEDEEMPELCLRYNKVLVRLLGELKMLKIVHIWPFPMSQGVINSISQLEFLSELHIAPWEDSRIMRHIPEYSSRNLTILRLLQSETWMALTNALNASITSPVKRVEARITNRLQDALRRSSDVFMHILDKLSQLPSLEHIQIQEVYQCPTQPEAHGQAGVSFGSLTNLQTFELVSSAALLLGNGWLKSISSCSNLTVLRVYADFHEVYPVMTLQGLIPVLTNCHNLHTLQVSVECCVFNLQQLANTKLAPVKVVTLIHSPLVGDRSVILRCLMRMFPAATMISGNYPPNMQGWHALNQVFAVHGRGARSVLNLAPSDVTSWTPAVVGGFIPIVGRK